MEKKNTRENIRIGELAQRLFIFLKEAATDPPWIEKDETGKWPEVEPPALKQIIMQLTSLHEEAAEKVDESYRGRRDNIKEVVEKRRKRLEAYAGRKRVAVAGEKDKFIVAGRVTDKTTGVGLPDVKVKAFDLDRKYDDRLGGAYTDTLGYFRINYTSVDFGDFGEAMPEIYLEVVDEDEKVLYTSPKSFVHKAGKFEYFDVEVEGAEVPRSLQTGAKINLSLGERLKVLDRRKRLLARTKSIT